MVVTSGVLTIEEVERAYPRSLGLLSRHKAIALLGHHIGDISLLRVDVVVDGLRLIALLLRRDFGIDTLLIERVRVVYIGREDIATIYLHLHKVALQLLPLVLHLTITIHPQ